MNYDIVINNGLVVFGNENQAEFLNLGIISDKIVDISKEKLIGKKNIDANGKIVSPGFIDPHCHSDLSVFFDYEMTSKIFQGVTTEISGNCGIGMTPTIAGHEKELKKYVIDHFLTPKDFKLEEYRDLNSLKDVITTKKTVTNQGYLVGTGCLRIGTKGFRTNEVTKLDLEIMAEALRKEFSAGALGVSFGLIYQPGNFMLKDEIIEIMKVVAENDKITSFHMRNEGENIIEAIKEVIDCAEKSKCKTNISHLKIMSKNNWGKSKEILQLLEDARNKGLKITYDQYPYMATSTTLMVLFPQEIFNGNIEEFITNISKITAEDRKKILANINSRGGSKNILISNTFLPNNKYSGKTVEDIMQEMKLNEVDTILLLVKETQGRAKAIYFSMCEEDMDNFMKCSYSVIGSDGSSIPIENINSLFGKPHPRNLGTFPKFIKLNREKQLFSIEVMINKITKRTADLYCIKDRGEIKIGNYADITIFDYNNVEDISTFENPFQKSKGIEYVIVNGKIVVENGNYTGIKAGIFID